MSQVKLIIAGTRDFEDYSTLKAVIQDQGLIDEENLIIISGMARGADLLGVRWAIQYKRPLIRMPADWDKYGRRAGYIRNSEMADVGTHLLALWDSKSRGTKNMIDIACDKGLEVCVFDYVKGQYLYESR